MINTCCVDPWPAGPRRETFGPFYVWFPFSSFVGSFVLYTDSSFVFFVKIWRVQWSLMCCVLHSLVTVSVRFFCCHMITFTFCVGDSCHSVWSVAYILMYKSVWWKCSPHMAILSYTDCQFCNLSNGRNLKLFHVYQPEHFVLLIWNCTIALAVFLLSQCLLTVKNSYITSGYNNFLYLHCTSKICSGCTLYLWVDNSVISGSYYYETKFATGSY